MKAVTVVAYVLPAGLVWSTLGAASKVVQAIPIASSVVMSICLIYMASFGLIEVVGLPVRSPTVKAGVPATWVQNRGWLQRTFIWGAMLGPGLLTVNPYASMWVVVMALVAVGWGDYEIWVGAAIGAAHGVGRAIGIMYPSTNCSDPFSIMASQIRWRQIDGFALLLAFGTFTSLLAQAIWSGRVD